MGSKAKNLKVLLDAGFNVPPFIAVPSDGLTAERLEATVNESFNQAPLFAVRSSADVEDGTEKSYAGHFFSAIAVEPCELFDAYGKVVRSYEKTRGEVIVQQFIPSDCAGVLFTNDGNGLMVINSNLGLCKTVVEGQACDEYYTSRDGKILSKHIAKYKTPLVYDKGLRYDGNVDKESLTPSQIEELVKEGLKVEEFFGSPQDVEWCFYQNRLFILQSRPITRFNSKNLVFYDSANIAESYSGIVLPLTHSFAKSIYKKVYENLLIASGASKRRVERNQHIFSNMVSNFYGRMYYNMNNWYLMMSFMPGYKRNKGNLEGMITSNIRVDVPRSVLPSVWLKVGYPFVLVYKLIVFQRVVNRFVVKVNTTIKEYRRKKIENFTEKQCVDLYHLLNQELLEQFHIPVENDFLLMSFLGSLRKKFGEDNLKQHIAFNNVSSNQVEAIATLSSKFFSVKQFEEVIEGDDSKRFTSLLVQYPDMKTLLDNYFDLYGGRFANELKLESADVEFEDKALFSMLRAYRNHKVKIEEKLKTGKPKGFALKRFVKYARQREELRLLRSNSFSLVRRIFRRLGVLLAKRGVLQSPEDIFYLTVDEAMLATSSAFDSDYKVIVSVRKSDYEKFELVQPPAFFTVVEGGQPVVDQSELTSSATLQGRSCTSGTVKGRVRVFADFSLPEKIDFEILVARNTDPGWAALIGLSKGIIVENGGILSHAAIVSRELGIPTVIGVANVTRILKTGQVVEINGDTGEIKIIEE